jgi:hypothetical protein
MRGWGLAWGSATIALALALPANAYAQTFEVGGGVRWVGPMTLGSANADETRPGGSTFTLFTSDSRLDSAAALEARFGVRLSDTLQVEATGSYAAPTLTARIASDVEGIPDVSISETITQYTVEGAAVLDLPRYAGARVMPFVSAGAGYNRQLHETATLIEHGPIYHVGGGVNVTLGEQSGGKAFGVRLDGRAVIRTGGVAFDDSPHVAPAFGATLFVRF